LLVDDEELVRMGTAEMLSDLGYEVVEANSAAEALRRLRAGETPDLLITDYLMPGMNGAELTEHARSLWPEMRVMLITGYSNVAEGPASSVPRLAKPFRQADLAQIVAQLLERDSVRGEVVPFPGTGG
jgi:CheY-like chemotaxis protein